MLLKRWPVPAKMSQQSRKDKTEPVPEQANPEKELTLEAGSTVENEECMVSL
jgi:hypothetical protein